MKHREEKKGGRSHPWREVLRNVFIATISLLPILPIIADTAGISNIPIVASVLTVTAAVSRVMALKQVDDWLEKHLPWLTPEQKGNHHNEPPH